MEDRPIVLRSVSRGSTDVQLRRKDSYPDGQIILIPPKPDLEIMVVRDNLQEIILQDLTLSGVHIVDPSLANLTSRGEQTLPARDRVGANDRMRSCEVQADIFGSTSLSIDELDPVPCRGTCEFRLIMCCSERLGEFLECG